MLTESSQMVLRKSGWTPGRNVGTASWVEAIEKAGYPVFPSLLNLLKEFGGIKVDTSKFEGIPLVSSSKQDIVLLKRSNPIFEFVPTLSDAMNNDAQRWQSLHFLEHTEQRIAPIGIYRFMYPKPIFDLFVLSDGGVYGGGEYFEYFKEDKEKMPSIFHLGDSVENAINNAINRFLVFQ